mmetsp:Transcript_18415/g.52796  ORF Transcript_18415/g.52796 Transcript_18415/m.52796 type:complete len:209 (-) Transcript_18415:580-1206(-)
MSSPSVLRVWAPLSVVSTSRVRRSTVLASTPPSPSTRTSPARPPTSLLAGVSLLDLPSCSRPPSLLSTSPTSTVSVASSSVLSTALSSLSTAATSAKACPPRRPLSSPASPSLATSSRPSPRSASRLSTRDSAMMTRRSSRRPTLPRTCLPRRSCRRSMMRLPPVTRSVPSSCTVIVSTSSPSARSMELTPGRSVSASAPLATTMTSP